MKKYSANRQVTLAHGADLTIPYIYRRESNILQDIAMLKWVKNLGSSSSKLYWRQGRRSKRVGDTGVRKRRPEWEDTESIPSVQRSGEAAAGVGGDGDDSIGPAERGSDGIDSVGPAEWGSGGGQCGR